VSDLFIEKREAEEKKLWYSVMIYEGSGEKVKRRRE